MKQYPLKTKILFSFLTFLFCLGILEAGSRVLLFVKNRIDSPQQREAVIQEKGFVRLKPHYSHKNDKTGEFFSINALGFRGREIARRPSAGTLRIVALGGSTTFGVGATDDSRTYPAILEKYLNRESTEPKKSRYEVINAGIPGALSTNLLHFFSERVLELSQTS